jgi:hypothetical protein
MSDLSDTQKAAGEVGAVAGGTIAGGVAAKAAEVAVTYVAGELSAELVERGIDCVVPGLGLLITGIRVVAMGATAYYAGDAGAKVGREIGEAVTEPSRSPGYSS